MARRTCAPCRAQNPSFASCGCRRSLGALAPHSCFEERINFFSLSRMHMSHTRRLQMAARAAEVQKKPAGHCCTAPSSNEAEKGPTCSLGQKEPAGQGVASQAPTSPTCTRRCWKAASWLRNALH